MVGEGQIWKRIGGEAERQAAVKKCRRYELQLSPQPRTIKRKCANRLKLRPDPFVDPLTWICPLTKPMFSGKYGSMRTS